ncbi:MAG: hypothetical protein BAJATHORv1_50189 [Candidatus Thorarchaeota archaeon]|nr:MAG: hypothetical protein BAJATHORv1_50189 [Candidatus Thorarchaeota archaeon]
MDEEHDFQETSEEADEIDSELPKEPVKLISEDTLDYHPRVSEPLELLVDPDTGVVVGRSQSFHKKYGPVGLGMLGAISETSDDILTSLVGTPVKLDLVSPHVMFVAGKRGSGKSYTLGIIAEELALAMERSQIEVAGVLIDTVDVFRQMVEPNVDQEDLLEKWGLDDRGFPVAVYIPRRTYAGLPDEVKKKARLYPLAISPRELSDSDWGYVLEKGGQLSTTMENLIGDIIDSLRHGYTLEEGTRQEGIRDFSINDMIRVIESNPAIQDLYKASTQTAMIQRLRRANRLGIFHPGGTSAQDLAIGGQITVIDVAPLGSDAESVLAILTNILCRQVLTYRMTWTDDGTSAREELPPTWLIVDEAHTLVPRTGNTPAKEAIISYAKLGRRFGCSLVLCTQQPSAVADDAISQSDIILSHSLSHDNDIRALQQRAPAVMPEQFKDKVFISSLPRGVALLFDQTTENKRGFIFKVRPRLSKHGGTDRLSGLFEAAKLAPHEEDLKDEITIQEVEIDESEKLEVPSDEFKDDEMLDEIEDEDIPDLPHVPRPPVKLSREDWELLDSWIQDYVTTLFEQKQQEFSITEETAPRETTEPEVSIVDEPIIEDYSDDTDAVIDVSNVAVRRFGNLQPTLLAKAMTRKVLYSRSSHEFLFPTESIERETVLIESDDVDPWDLVERITGILVERGLHLDSLRHEDDFTFVLLRKDEVRVAFSAGISENTVCIPVIFSGTSRRGVSILSDQFRVAMR